MIILTFLFVYLLGFCFDSPDESVAWKSFWEVFAFYLFLMFVIWKCNFNGDD